MMLKYKTTHYSIGKVKEITKQMIDMKSYRLNYSESFSHTFSGICKNALFKKFLKCLPMA